jgi:hypothetical protein
MNGYRMNMALLTALIAALILIACGQESRRVPSSVITSPQSPASISINEALAELDAMQTPKGVDPAVFAQLKTALRAALIARGEGKLVSTPPTGVVNAVPDFNVTDTGGGTADLTWHYYNKGDYNQDGVVGIADITPLAMHYGEGWAIGEENTLAAVVDGSGDGTVNIADVTQIAMYFGVEAEGYFIESSNTEGGTYTQVQSVSIIDGLDKATGRMRFAVNISFDPTLWYHVVPTDSSLAPGVPSNAVQLAVPGTPVASIVPGVASGPVPLDVILDASGSTDSDGTIVLYEWDLDGDGTFDFDTGVTPNTNATYTAVGEYHPAVRVTDNDSLTDTASVTITVSAANLLPTAVLTSDINNGPPPLSVAFDASGSSDTDGTIVSYEWDMAGDGTFELNTGLTATIGYDYTTYGIFNPAVRVTDNNGGQATASIPINVNYQTWASTWGSTNTEYSRSVAVSPSGFIYMVGNTDSFGSMTDATITMYADWGVPGWVKTWGGASDDIAYDIDIDGAGDLYVVGATGSYTSGSYDAFLLKLDSQANIIWQYNWGGAGVDEATGVCLDSLGNIYVAGKTDYNPSGSDFFLYKFDSTGVVQWRKVWSNYDWEYANNLTVDAAGNIYVVGGADTIGDAVLLKYDTDGILLWQKTWGGANSETPFDVAVDSGGNIFVTGETDSFGAGGNDVFLIKYDLTGVLLWQQIWGGALQDSPARLSIDNATGDIFVAGGTTSFGVGDTDAFVLQYDTSGALLKQVAWGGADEDKAMGLDIGSLGELYFCGYSHNASGTWRTITGTVTPGTGIAADYIGTFDDPMWVANVPPGAVSEQTGIIDTGGGGDDELLVKQNPFFF